MVPPTWRNNEYFTKNTRMTRSRKKLLDSSFLTASQQRHGSLDLKRIMGDPRPCIEGKITPGLGVTVENSLCWGWMFCLLGNVHRELSWESLMVDMQKLLIGISVGPLWYSDLEYNNKSSVQSPNFWTANEPRPKGNSMMKQYFSSFTFMI